QPDLPRGKGCRKAQGDPGRGGPNLQVPHGQRGRQPAGALDPRRHGGLGAAADRGRLREGHRDPPVRRGVRLARGGRASQSAGMGSHVGRPREPDESRHALLEREDARPRDGARLRAGGRHGGARVALRAGHPDSEDRGPAGRSGPGGASAAPHAHAGAVSELETSTSKLETSSVKTPAPRSPFAAYASGWAVLATVYTALYAANGVAFGRSV